MKTGWIALVSGVLACTAAMAADDFAGKYAGAMDSYKWHAAITPKGPQTYKVTIEVASQMPACGGNMEAVGRLQAGRIITLPADSGDTCSLTISKSGGGISVVEHACDDAHGVACGFTSHMKRVGR